MIGISLNGEHIKGSPFACQVYDPGEIEVFGLDVGIVGQELNFTVNAERAGEGRLHVII